MKIRKYVYGGKNGGEPKSFEIEVKSSSLMEAVRGVEAAVKAGKTTPTHFKVKACFYEDEE
jgi:hypothetical protein